MRYFMYAGDQEQKVINDYVSCQAINLTILSDTDILLRAANKVLEDATSTQDQILGNDEYLIRITRAIERLTKSTKKLESANPLDSQLLQIKSDLIDSLRAIQMVMCGDNAVVILASPVTHDIELAKQALAAEKERTGDAFPALDQLVTLSCERLSFATEQRSLVAIQSYNDSLHDVINFVNNIPPPAERPLDLSLLAIGFTLGAGAVFTFLLLAYMVARRSCVSRGGIFSNNYRTVQNTDEEEETLELESVEDSEQETRSNSV
jgi:hypothetical protein